VKDQEKEPKDHKGRVMEIKKFSCKLIQLEKVKMGSEKESEGKKLFQILISYKEYNFFTFLALTI
jgi:hypothetical protein